MKSELVPLNGDPPIPITRDVTVIGRREYCDVQLDHPSLSKRHCVLVRTDGLLMLRDLATTNGTKVNGQRVMWAALLPNDRLTLGQYKFKVYLGPDDAASPSEQKGAENRRAEPARVASNGRSPVPALGRDEPTPELLSSDEFASPAATERLNLGDGRGFQLSDLDDDGPIIDLD